MDSTSLGCTLWQVGFFNLGVEQKRIRVLALEMLFSPELKYDTDSSVSPCLPNSIHFSAEYHIVLLDASFVCY